MQNDGNVCKIFKTAKKVRPEDLKGLKAIADLKGVKKRILVYLGTTQLKTDGIEILPFPLFCHKFLTA